MQFKIAFDLLGQFTVAPMLAEYARKATHENA
jgi:hypothetical protein